MASEPTASARCVGHQVGGQCAAQFLGRLAAGQPSLFLRDARAAHAAAIADHEHARNGGFASIAPHHDHGFITILPLSDVPGLEVKTPDGRWITANVVPDSVIINTGEFLNRWSNGVLPASPHRVMPPPRDRYSIALFFNPNHDTISTPLPGCAGPGNPAKFKPVRFIDSLGWYVDQNFKKGAGGAQGDGVAA